jgi:lysophospholipase L1-like esterase
MAMISARRARLLAGATALALLVAPSGLARAASDEPLPRSMAALGDSISRGFDACGFYVDCSVRSWSTGDDTEVDSQRSRLAAAGAPLSTVLNLARTGATVAALGGQAGSAVASHVDYVTIEIGANDACRPDVSAMTPVGQFRSQLRAALRRLHGGLPQARVFLASVPDLMRLWEIGHDNRVARFAWSRLHICPSMLAAADSEAPADVARREQVRAQVVAYNAELASACADYGPDCRYDQGAVFAERFTIHEISKWDWFHPNVFGQHALADVTWQAGFFAVATATSESQESEATATPARSTSDHGH